MRGTARAVGSSCLTKCSPTGAVMHYDLPQQGRRPDELRSPQATGHFLTPGNITATRQPMHPGPGVAPVNVCTAH